MTTGALPQCSGNEGLQRPELSQALDKAAQTRDIVDIYPVCKPLGR